MDTPPEGVGALAAQTLDQKAQKGRVSRPGKVSPLGKIWGAVNWFEAGSSERAQMAKGSGRLLRVSFCGTTHQEFPSEGFHGVLGRSRWAVG